MEENFQNNDVVQEDGQAIATFKRTESEVESILRVSIRALHLSVVFLAFFISLFYTLFPYRALLMYSDFGLKERAYFSARKYVLINEDNYIDSAPSYDSKYADALLACVNNSISLMNSYKSKLGISDKKTEFFANEVIWSVDKYLSYPSMTNRSTRVNEYNLTHLTPSLRAYFYDFETDILRARARALVYTGNLATIFHEVLVETNNMTASDHVPTDNTIARMVRSFYLISEVVEAQLDSVGYFEVETYNSGLPNSSKLYEARLPIHGDSFRFLYNKSIYVPHPEYNDSNQYHGATPVYIRIYEHIEAYKAFIMGMEVGSNRDEALRKLYYTKGLTDMTMNIFRFMDLAWKSYPSVFKETILSNDFVYIMDAETYDKWVGYRTFELDNGSKKNPLEYFQYELLQYVNMFVVG